MKELTPEHMQLVGSGRCGGRIGAFMVTALTALAGGFIGIAGGPVGIAIGGTLGASAGIAICATGS